MFLYRIGLTSTLLLLVEGCILANPAFDGPLASDGASEGATSATATTATTTTTATTAMTTGDSSASSTEPTSATTDAVTTGVETDETDGTDGTDGTESTTSGGGVLCDGPAVEWVVRFHGAGVQHAKSVAVKGGDLAVVGTYNGSLMIDSKGLDDSGPPSEGSDVFVARFTGQGELQWLKTFVGAGEQIAEAVTMDDLGNMIFAVRNSGTVDFGGGDKVAKGVSDAVLVKLNTSGGHLGSWMYSSPGEAVILDVAIGEYDEILVAGAFNMSLTAEPSKEVPMMGSAQMTGFVARLKSDAQAKWLQRLEGEATSYVYDLELNGMNEVVFAGAFSGGQLKIDLTTLANKGAEDAFAARIHGDTNVLLWSGSAGDELGQNVRQVGLGAPGTMLFAGSYRGALGDSLVNPSMVDDAYLLQYSDDQEMWALSVGTGLPLQSRALVVDSMTGTSVWGGDLRGDTSLGDCALSSPNPGFFLSGVTSDGEVEWATAYSAEAAAGIEGLASPKPTAVAAVGWYEGSLTLGDEVLPAPVDGSEDSFLVRLAP